MIAIIKNLAQSASHPSAEKPISSTKTAKDTRPTPQPYAMPAWPQH